MRPLYAIRNDVLSLNDLLDEIEGDLSRAGELGEALHSFMAGLEAEQAEKLDSFLNLIRQLRMEAVAAKAEREQWAAKEKARNSRADYLERMLREHLEATGQPKVQTATGRTVAVVTNGGRPPVVYAEAVDPAAVPVEFVRVKKEIDTLRVQLFLESGGSLPFAKLGEKGSHLRVR